MVRANGSWTRTGVNLDGGFCSFAGLLVAFVVVWENVRFIMTVPSVFVFVDVTERQGKSSWTDSPTLLV